MSATFFSAFAFALSFDSPPVAVDSDGDDDASPELSLLKQQQQHQDAEMFKNDIVHGFSLLHAVCLQNLRCDWELSNLTEHNEQHLPAWDSAQTRGFPIKFHHYCIPRNRKEARLAFYKVSKIQVVGGVSATEKRVLGKQVSRTLTMKRGPFSSHHDHNGSTNDGKDDDDNSTAPFFSNLWTSDTASFIRGAVERPYQVLYALLECLHTRHDAGGLNMPAPILATVWQSINTGIQSFEHCRYLADTPFPFPWAQLVIVVLLSWQFLIPLTVIVSYESRALGVVVAMASCWVLWALNEVAREIEDPFTSEPNDLPLARLQYHFNEQLLAVAASASSREGLGWSVVGSRRKRASGGGEDGGDNGGVDGLNGVDDIGLYRMPTYAGGIDVSRSGSFVEGV